MTEKPKWTEGEWAMVDSDYDAYFYVQSEPWMVARCLKKQDAHLLTASKKLYEALEAMTEHYVDLAGCGDCGHWNPEEEEQVINSRTALKQARGEAVERAEMPVKAPVAPEGTQDTLERKEGFYWVRDGRHNSETIHYTECGLDGHNGWAVCLVEGDFAYPPDLDYRVPIAGCEIGPRLEPPTFTTQA